MKTHLDISKLCESASLIEQQIENDQQEILHLEDEADIQDDEENSTNWMSYDVHAKNYSEKYSSSTSHFEKILSDGMSFMLTLVSRRFPLLGEVSFCIRTLPNC